MNKVLKWIALGALGILVIGVGVLMAGKCLGGSLSFAYDLKDHKILSLDNQKMVEKTIEIEDFDDLSVYTTEVDVKVKPGDKNEVYYKVAERLEPEINCENGKLSVNNKENGLYVKVGIDVYNEEDNIIEITVKKDSLKNLDISKSSGDFTIEGLDVKGKIHSSAGEVVIKDSENGEDLFIHISAGEIQISDSSFTKFEKKQSAGDSIFTNFKAEDYTDNISAGSNSFDKCELGNLYIHSSSGDTKVSDSKLGDCKLENSAGDFSAKNSEVGSVDAKISAGSISLNIIGEKDDFNYDIDASAGDIEIDGTHVQDFKDDNGADKNIKAKVSAGDFNVTFTK
ncbi:MAG: DUF4097 domain-containing protein [Lachnospiraceae bacterium]|nr:DUF4097 domain-containing protein [Lachnospiraceae bacterium]